jgi:PAS domain S-box-containing protein
MRGNVGPVSSGKPPVDARLYQLVVEQARDYAMFMLDPAGRIISWNRGAERIKGYAAHEIIGRHFSTFYLRDAVERGWPDHELKLAAAEGRFEDEGWRVRKDGSRFWANVVITALRDENGRLLGFSKLTRDLSERKAQDEALRQSEERFRLLVEGVTDYAVFMLDPEGLVSSWNAGAEKIKGYRREEILHKHISRFYPAADIEAGKPWEELATARRTGRCEAEGWRIRKGGERFWARGVLTALRDADGRLRGFAKVTQDLTERRQLQHLEQAARNVNEFLAMLAHELRNPLAPIRAAADAMARLPPDAARFEELRRIIERQAAQLSRIVEDMVDISRVTRGALSLQRAPLALADVAHAAVETVRPAVEAARHRLAVELPGAPLTVEGDAHRLTQLLTNLLSNAARYTPPGGDIALRLRAERGQAVVTVTDNGRGIEPQIRDRIFDMFVQGRPPLERVGGGLGVGLALARRIAELHGGTLEARSEGENRGSEFTLRLPLAAGAPQAAAPAASAAARTAARRVLIVDDNADAAVTLELLLQSLGHETRVAHDGAAALEAAARFRPDIVLLDIGLPGIDGYEVARRLREANPERPLRIVAVTGWGAEADRRRSEQAGFDLHLVKPLDPEALSQALEKAGPTLH